MRVFYIEDKEGKPVAVEDMLTWSKWMEENEERKRVGLAELGEGGTISTVFLGLDHGWGEGHAPMLYETLVFGGPRDGWMVRYGTREMASRGHEGMIREVQRDMELIDEINRLGLGL